MKKQTTKISEILLKEFPRIGLIRQSELIPDILPFSQATLWRMVKNGKFPKPIKVSARITAWKRQDIAEYLDMLMNEVA